MKSRNSKKTQDMVVGGGLAILGEWAADKFMGGVLTDQTGTLIKIGVGGFLLMKGKKNLMRGVGAGLVANNALKLATGKNLPQTLGIAGVTPYYRQISGTGVKYANPAMATNKAESSFQ